MDIKKIFGSLFTLGGAASLVFGIIGLFNGELGSQSWTLAILGVIFFGAGIGLLKSIRTIDTK